MLTSPTAISVDPQTPVAIEELGARQLPARHGMARLLPVRAGQDGRLVFVVDAFYGARMPSAITWTVPEGGFFIWVTLPQEIDTTRMHPQVRELGVEYLPGATCFTDGSGANQLRLSFSFVEDERIAQGVRTIADVIRGELHEARG